jgi:endoglucanase
MGKTKNKKLFGRIVAYLMTFAMVLSCVGFTSVTSKAATGPVATAINSIKYDITVSGVDDETSLTWTSQDAGWTNRSVNVPLENGNGGYTFTAEYSSTTGFKNVGYFAESNNENLTITVTKMTVNGEYEIALGVDLKPGVEDESGSKSYNALKNIWGGFSDGQVIYGDAEDDYYIAYDATNDEIRFYVIGEVEDKDEVDDEVTDGPVVTKINSIQYDINVSGIADEESLTWSSQDAGWSVHTVNVPLENGDGDYTFTAEYDGINGFKNMGFFPTSDNENLTIKINQMTVNGEYAIELGITLTPGVEDENGSKSNNALKNIWGGFSDGAVVYGDKETAYFGYSKSDDTIFFYAPKTADVTTNQSSTPVKTDITSLEYIGTIAGVEGAGSFGWSATKSSWGEGTTTVDYTGDGAIDFTIDLTNVSGDLINLGYGYVDASAETKTLGDITLTINQIIVNDYYTLNLAAPVSLSGTANGLTNRWGIGKDAVLAQDELGLATLSAKYILDGEDNASIIEFNAPSVSYYYVLSMGDGWNLGNTFDGVNTNADEEDEGETAWGNPTVTKEFIQAVADKGYDSIRMPMTLERRYSQDEEGNYVIDEAWLARYKEVVEYATDLGLHVMINIHHDSWAWLANWDGKEDSEEYVKYTQLWTQLAEYFKDESYLVSFETINEPYFDENITTMSQQRRLDAINTAAYNIIRNSGGKNAKRIIIMPTLSTNYEKSEALYNLICSLDDPYVVATVHYYSEWVYSANLGRTGFDEDLWGSGDYTPRDSVDTVFSSVYDTFVKNGIGVVVGEYGLLGYDAGEQTNQLGEELKYYDYVNYVAKQKGLCLMFWDNGSGIDRTDTVDYSWKKAQVGAVLEAALNNERSSYATGLDTIYLKKETKKGVSIPLTLNGNTFVSVSDANGTLSASDYTYDEATATLTLSKAYVNKAYASLGEGEYGEIADLTLTFSAGADWHEHLVKCGLSEFTDVQVNIVTNDDGEESENGIEILADFNGADVRRVTAYEDENRVGPNSSWWQWLQKDSAYATIDNSLKLLSSFFDDSSVKAGELTLSVEMYDGQIVEVKLDVAEDGAVTFISSTVTYEGSEDDGDDDPDDGSDPGDDGSDPGTEGGTNNKTTAAKKGTILKDTANKAKYKVTSAATAKTHTVTYMGTTSSSKKKINVPASVKIGGVTYKVTAIAASALKKNTKITSVTIGKNVKTIGKNAFNGCTKLKKVTFKSGSALTSIGSKAFYKCTALTKITIPAKVKTIGSSAFYGCKKLKTVTFKSGSKLTTISASAFAKCTALTKITIPAKVSKIGSKAFYGCTKLKTVTIKTKKLTTKKVGKNAFAKINSKATVKVPASKLKAYKKILKKKGITGKKQTIKKISTKKTKTTK